MIIWAGVSSHYLDSEIEYPQEAGCRVCELWSTDADRLAEPHLGGGGPRVESGSGGGTRVTRETHAWMQSPGGWLVLKAQMFHTSWLFICFTNGRFIASLEKSDLRWPLVIVKIYGNYAYIYGFSKTLMEPLLHKMKFTSSLPKMDSPTTSLRCVVKILVIDTNMLLHQNTFLMKHQNKDLTVTLLAFF